MWTQHDLNFKSIPESFKSDHAVSLVPVGIEGFEPILGARTIKATLPDPNAIYNKFGFAYFRADVDEKILLKFAFGKHSLEILTSEAQAYLMLNDLQGSIIPSFKGLYRVIDDPKTLCLITTDVGDSSPVQGSLFRLPKEDRMQIARLLPFLCDYGVSLTRLDRNHVLQRGNRYWLHNLHDLDDHTCALGHRPQDDGHTEADLVFREFTCRRVQSDLHAMRLWGWPRPNTVVIDNMPYAQYKYPPQALIDALWLPTMSGHPIFFCNWYRSIKTFVDENSLDLENDSDMQKIIAYGERRKVELHFLP